eukprot:TRINITY_DN878_c1_g1_i1.p1 TRINITY_DN878_c1_g1~~TRINITY_DN878_c1_g1_i1.p1  ORF type:complete len:530 (+),score=84.68 TRINITY_DN878_c1_g1_i1:178-1767(+)
MYINIFIYASTQIIKNQQVNQKDSQSVTLTLSSITFCFTFVINQLFELIFQKQTGQKVNGMDQLKALINEKKKQTREVFGQKKYVKRAEVEADRLKRLREEEEEDNRLRGKKISKVEADNSQSSANQSNGQKHTQSDKNGQAQNENLPKEEVIRRLRALNQPATLFGEDDLRRLKRLYRAEEELEMEDEMTGGQQENSILEMKKGLYKSQQAPNKKGQLEGEKQAKKETEQSGNNVQNTQLQKAGGGQSDQEGDLWAAYQRAAETLKQQKEEEGMAGEDLIALQLQRWMKEWEEDLEARPDHVKNTAAGRAATTTQRQTQIYMEPLYRKLGRRQVDSEVRSGLWMIVRSMRERNYLFAFDIYLKLAIGTAPWPIGVTSVGIHERSAREKISYSWNGQAHIMNDEATRKYLQAIRRLMIFVQRKYPTDPSRAVDFNAWVDPGRGAAGGGSDKQALLEAQRSGTTWKDLGLAEAPHFVEGDGSIKVPPKWSAQIKNAENDLLQKFPQTVAAKDMQLSFIGYPENDEQQTTS